jgi:hypothetical protein
MPDPAYGVKLDRGTVTHWGSAPLITYEQARDCLQAIRAHTGEDGKIVTVFTQIPAMQETDFGA